MWKYKSVIVFGGLPDLDKHLNALDPTTVVISIMRRAMGEYIVVTKEAGD